MNEGFAPRQWPCLAAVLLAALVNCTGVLAAEAAAANGLKSAPVMEAKSDPLDKADKLAKTAYLAADAEPSSLAQLPPPPAPGSAAMALDEDIARRSFALRDTPRWVQAALDADQTFPKAAGSFSCALGVGVSEADTPRLYRLLQRSGRDLSASTRSAKEQYKRPRPFLSNDAPICTPDYQKALAKEGSYPSGHSTTGFGWALILAELAPDRTDALMQRARAYGESRNVCNVHWHSDIMQGRLLAAGVFARLHADAAFRADVEAARTELQAARARHLPPVRDCSAEAAALAAEPSLAQ